MTERTKMQNAPKGTKSGLKNKMQTWEQVAEKEARRISVWKENSEITRANFERMLRRVSRPSQFRPEEENSGT